MNYMNEYKSKLRTADEAVQLVKSGDWVDYQQINGAALMCDRALAKRVGDLKDVKVRIALFPGTAEIAKADPNQESFTYYNFHFGEADRRLGEQGLCEYIPNLYRERPIFFDRFLQSDVLMVRTAAIDKWGFFNFSANNSDCKAVARNTKKIIVEANRQMPYCLGGFDEKIHISEVDCIVEADYSPLILPETTPTERDIKIAKYILEEMEDGCCIQLGIGGMPNTVGKLVADSDLKDIGVHTEMFADAYVDMYEAGKITGKRKTLMPEKMVYTFAMGTKKLYEFLDYNPACASFPVSFTNRPSIIASNDKMVSINNAIEVDLYGQVSSESSGFKHISGTGGQWDYHYASYHSRGGKSFICLNSTYKDRDGNLKSRIVPIFSPGSVVTLPRTHTFYVVTEFGKAMLKGKSIWERAEALISIAHPDFRSELTAEAEKMGIWSKTNRIPQPF